MPRILVCRSHKTADVLPDFHSDVSDPHERAKLDRHLTEAIEGHYRRFGSDPSKHIASPIIQVAEDELELLGGPDGIKNAVVDDRGIETVIRELREELKADALRCYNLHNRPTYGVGYGIGCTDYRSDSKKLTKAKGANTASLCDYCVYNSYVEHYKNTKVKFKGEK